MGLIQIKASFTVISTEAHGQHGKCVNLYSINWIGCAFPFDSIISAKSVFCADQFELTLERHYYLSEQYFKLGVIYVFVFVSLFEVSNGTIIK